MYLSKQRKWLGFEKWTFIFCPKTIFPEKNLAKKSMIFIFA